MDLSVLETTGLPEGSILSVRSGPTRRQSALPCSAPFKLPAGPWPLRIDVLASLARSLPGASLENLDKDNTCRVPLEARDSRQMSVTVKVFNTAGGTRPSTAPAGNQKEGEDADMDGSPLKRRDTEADARAYLDRHRLHEFMHALFELLLRERPDDPFTFIAERFREAAKLEANNPVLEATAPNKHKVSRSIVSTAPTSTLKTASVCEDLPEGMTHVTICTMRGRTLAKLPWSVSEPMSALKDRIESSLGVPPAAQQLLWSGEMLPNGTSLEDHYVPARQPATLNLVRCGRDPRLRHTISGAGDGLLRIWSLENGESIKDLPSSGPLTVLSLAADWDNGRLLCGCLNGELHLYDLTEAAPVAKRLVGHAEEVSVLCAHWHRMQALSGSGDGSARLWDLHTLKCLQVFEAGSWVKAMSVDWPGSRLCVGLTTGILQVWDIDTATKVQELKGGADAAKTSQSSVASTSIDIQSRRAVSGFEDGRLAYWHFEAPDADSSATVPAPKVLIAHYSAVRALETKWSENTCKALAGSDDGSLSLWNLGPQECLARFARHVGMVWAMHADWSRDRCVSGAFDGCIKLWNLRTGECLRTLQGHHRPVRCIAGGTMVPEKQA
eukprot:TRINITY_DN81777_c0_g1_i1.p1 TRINITY_DN81777_c0_g1~~TRINITY_DN81777_c0_g1_i1.p1  ORF type:complete len:612 (-),score=87.11 TRINITY_DN81777_c0_g1_i1:349-2184(-)